MVASEIPTSRRLSLTGTAVYIARESLRYYRNEEHAPVKYPLLEDCLSLALLSKPHAKYLGTTAMNDVYQ